jgi:hypothetical protein
MMGCWGVRLQRWVRKPPHPLFSDFFYVDIGVWNQVPGEISEDVFWIRYFFRVYQINQEDEQRKAVLSGKVLFSLPRSFF